jgi:ATP-dependent Lhr-like helicase
LFPWLGTRSFRTCRKYLKKNAKALGISSIEFEGCNYMTFKLETLESSEWLLHLADMVRRDGIDCMMLMERSELPVFEKYDDCIPPELLRRAYAVDRLRADEVTARIMEWEREALI